MTADRLPPQDLDAEKALLGAMMSGGREVFDDVIDVIETPEAFAVPAHRALYDTLLVVYESDQPVDYIVVADTARRLERFELIGGGEYMVHLAESFGDYANARYYAEVVMERWRLRSLYGLGSRLMVDAVAPLAESAAIIGTASEALERAVAHRNGKPDRAPILIRSLPTYWQRADQFVPTGLDKFDHDIGGLPKAALTLLAARPSIGKTTFACNVLVAAAQAGFGVACLSLEMSAERIAEKLLLIIGQTPVGIVKHRMSPDERDALIRHVETTLEHGKPVWIRDGMIRQQQVVAAAQRFARQGAELIIVDYLQLCQPAGKHESVNSAVAGMSRAFKGLAVTTGAALLVLSQLSRQVEQTEREPILSDLRDSGSLEQDADVVVFLHAAKKDREESLCPTLVKVAKNRLGPLSRVKVEFHKPTQTFRRAATQT